EARRAADEILSRPEYQWSDDRTILERAAEWVTERLESLLSGLGLGVAGIPTWVGWVVLALRAALVAWLVWRNRSAWRRRSRVRGRGTSAAGIPSWAGWAVRALLAALVAWLGWRNRGAWRRSPRVPEDGAGQVLVSVDDEAVDDEAVDWEAEVARCEAEGRWRDAVRARYRVLVGDLAGRGVIGDLVGRTARELVDDVRAGAPQAAAAF